MSSVEFSGGEAFSHHPLAEEAPGELEGVASSFVLSFLASVAGREDLLAAAQADLEYMLGEAVSEVVAARTLRTVEWRPIPLARLAVSAGPQTLIEALRSSLAHLTRGEPLNIDVVDAVASAAGWSSRASDLPDEIAATAVLLTVASAFNRYLNETSG